MKKHITVLIAALLCIMMLQSCRSEDCDLSPTVTQEVKTQCLLL